jgi:hypothetical protein
MAKAKLIQAENRSPVQRQRNQSAEKYLSNNRRTGSPGDQPADPALCRLQEFSLFRCARILLGSVEVIHTIAKDQMEDGGSPTDFLRAILFVASSTTRHESLAPFAEFSGGVAKALCFWLSQESVLAASL